MACILCGKKDAPWKVTHNDPTLKKKAKTVAFCSGCRETAMASFDGLEVPLVWIGKEDLTNRYEDDPDTLKIIDGFTREDFKEIANIMADWFWDQFSEWYSDSACEAFEDHLRYKEEEMVKKTPKKNLPLLIGSLKYEENKVILEERMKGVIP